MRSLCKECNRRQSRGYEPSFREQSTETYFIRLRVLASTRKRDRMLVRTSRKPRLFTQPSLLGILLEAWLVRGNMVALCAHRPHPPGAFDEMKENDRDQPRRSNARCA